MLYIFPYLSENIDMSDFFGMVFLFSGLELRYLTKTMHHMFIEYYD